MKKIIKKILKEDRQEQFLNKIILLMKDDFPLFKKLDDYGFNLSEKELNYVLSGIFGEPVIKRDKGIYNKNRNMIYYETSTGHWEEFKYNDNGDQIYYENYHGFWIKNEYDENGNKIYLEISNGYWEKFEYDEYGNEIYNEDSNGNWVKQKYDENGNKIYYEDSNGNIW